MPFSHKSAYAFEIDGVTYPNSLAGVTVTMNPTITAPPSSLTGQWWVLDITTISADASPNGIIANSVYFGCETPSSVQQGDPWYWYSSCAPDFQSVGYLPGVDYFGRFGYDGYVNAWWGLKIGVSSPTINFYDTFNSSTYGPIIVNHDFIIWVCENSDYFTRYGGSSWTTPIVVTNGYSFGWYGPASNVASTLQITNITTNQVVYTSSTFSNEGSFTAPSSGSYRFTWTYTIDGLTRTSAYVTHPVTVPTSTTINIVSASQEVESSALQTVKYIVRTTGPVASVKMQYSEDNGNTWTTYVLGAGDFTQTSSGNWELVLGIQSNQVYRAMVSSSDSSQNPVYYEFGAAPQSTFDFARSISNVVDYVSSFIRHVGDLFAWLPVELRAFIISIIIIMVTLGLFGWLKS